MGITVKQFKENINNKILNIKGKYIDLVSGNIHRELGGYPGKNHSMPNCCNAMRSLMIDGDIVLCSPRKGNGATLKVRFYKR